MQPDFLIYCERLGPGVLAEPVNLASNIGFLAAGGWALDRCRRAGLRPAHWDLWLLSVLLVAIGVGSALWHSLHTGWAHSLDVLPILLFIHLYLFSFLWRAVGWHPASAALGTAAFFIASKLFAGTVDPDLLNGSVFYLPALAVLSLLVAWSYFNGHPGKRLMGAALLLFIASLALRTVDGTVCGWMPIGTHFGWHLLNAVVLAMLLGVVCRKRD